ncbi:photosystem I reaction center subunit PsaK [Nostoc sp. UCD121]|uniref:photosystem I reaction center subunit PsaK n=1 Tax=unclassified Nostoc TaxID=2593658 RepID=UPI0016250ED1|nr:MULTISPECIES: photosystem I reaction center subunit PsaK [unclassified Nostoc]MBC1223887.1 photosystem I reaction center subunit PsaK [Nostoc sp. UCD120]MBC1275049.1 photosystem I reaction center subunit PsaK [Nostoc sp. UCD121]MBC1293773.1 photosystem I reaction center subunit PsaK [Nostoc sp. UCD122]
MMSSILLAAQATLPKTGTGWNLTEAGIITGACLLCLLIIPRTIRYPHVGPKMPLPFPSLFNNPSAATFLAAMSAGHLIGTGTVLGLSNLGII